MAAAVPAVSWHAPSAGDGQRGGERLFAEPGPLGVLFLYRELLERDLDLEGVLRARKPQRLPVVLTEEEVRSVLKRLEGSEALVAGLLYGSGLRLMEALRLRVHDLDFNRQELTVRHGKGGKDRRTMLPKQLSKKLGVRCNFPTP